MSCSRTGASIWSRVGSDRTLPCSFSTSTSSQPGTSISRRGDERGLDDEQVLGLVGDGDDVAGTDPVRRDVDAAAVHEDVAVADDLACLVARRGEAETVDDVVEPALEQAQQVLARDALLAARELVVAAELLLEQAVDALRLLLLAKLDAVLRVARALLARPDPAGYGRRSTPHLSL